MFKTEKEIKTNQSVLIVNPDNSDSGKVYKHRIKIGDRLSIRFLNNFDIGQGAGQGATASGNSALIGGEEKGYLVNYDSTCTLPLIGRTNLVGLTRLEAAKKLERDYGKYIIDPIIDVNIISLSVTILGEVGAPGRVHLDRENTTVVDVIALAGGLKEGSRKSNIKIIRGSEIIIIDMHKIDILNNPNIIVHDNDIIYVQPIGTKAQTEFITTILPVTTLLVAITQFVIISIQVYTLSSK